MPATSRVEAWKRNNDAYSKVARLKTFMENEDDSATEFSDSATLSFTGTNGGSSQFMSNLGDPSESSERSEEDDLVGLLRSEPAARSSTSMQGTGRGALKVLKPKSSSMTSKTNRESMQELTINKLQLSRLSMYGRSEEIASLMECWKRAQSSDVKRREFALVSGYSGTGKSALVRQLEKPVERAGGFFAFGKFDLQKRGEPYYGVATACHDLCLAIKNAQSGPKPSLKVVGIWEKIKEELGPNTKVLVRLLPILKEMLELDSSLELGGASSSSKNKGLGMLEERNRFNYAFRRFLRIISSFGPVVLILDDLQWVDVASMDLLENLIQDAENPRLMVIGLYRSNEVDENHLMTKMVRDIELTSEEQGVNITKMELGNLTVSDVNELLDDLLYTDPGKSSNLAEIVHRKTSGNVFFVIQFLLALNAHDLLTYDFGMTKWRWNEENIENWTAATANVVDLMRRKLDTLKEDVVKKLPVVAYLGATFKNRLLYIVLESFEEIKIGKCEARSKATTSSGSAALEMKSFLEDSISEGIIESAGEDSYRWIHDKIHEASLTIVSEMERKQWRLMVGRVLKERLFFEEVEENLFLIVNLFEDTVDLVPTDDPFRIEVAKFFLRAGKKAQASSAFRQAGFYLNKGIDLLPENHWKTHYKLSLDLFSSAAEAEYCFADIDKMEEHCQEVLAQDHAPYQDKFRCYLNLVEGPARHNDLSSAIDMTLSILDTLGCKFPSKPFHAPVAIKRLLSWKGKLTKKVTAEVIDGLDKMTDAKRIFCMHLLEKLDPFCYISGNKNLFILVVLKRIEWTIRYGYCLHSPSAFSSIGIIYTGALGDITLGELCAKHCLSLQDKLSSRPIESGNFLRCYGLNLHSSTQLMTCMKGLLSGYQVGLEMGDLTSSMFGIYQYLELCRASGKSLEILHDDYLTYIQQMKETQQLQALEWSLVEYQGVLNLIGQSEHTVLLTGDAMDQEKVLATVEQTKNLTLRDLVRRKQMYLACFLDEHILGADLALKYGNGCLDTLLGTNGVFSQCFLSALSCISAFKETKKGKYKNYAKRMTSRIRGWIKKGNPNIVHYGMLLDAEWMTMNSRKRSVAHKGYEEANMFAARSGFIHDRALINERYGEFLLELGPENAGEAKYRLKEAALLYTEWGADRKVHILCEKHKIPSSDLPQRNRNATRALNRVGYMDIFHNTAFRRVSLITHLGRTRHL